VLELPTVGVTHRPLVAEGEWPAEERGARSPLRLGDELSATGCGRGLARARWPSTRPGGRIPTPRRTSSCRPPMLARPSRCGELAGEPGRHARWTNGHDWRRRRERWRT
jgi:deoxyribonuclease V